MTGFVRLGDVVDINPRGVPNLEFTDDIAFVAMADVTEEGVLRTSRTRPYAEVAAGYTPFQDGDVLLAKITPCFENGKSCLVSGMSPQYGFGSTEFHVLRAGRKMDSRFLHHLVRSSKFRSEGRRRMTGSAGQKRVPTSFIDDYLVNLPAINEQRRIATILDKADAIRKKRREALKLADDFLRSVFLDMFGDPVRNHQGWTQSTLGEIAPGRGEIVDGPFGSSLKPDQYVDEGVRVIRNFNVRPGYFDPSAYKYVTLQKFAEIRRSEVTEGDLLLSTKGTVGNVCLMPCLEGPSVLSATGTVRIRVSSPDVETLFLMYQMLTTQYQRYIEENQSGAVQQYLNLSGIRDLAIILPPRALQSKFTGIARRVSVLAEKCSYAYGEADKLYGSLAHRAFSGQL